MGKIKNLALIFLVVLLIALPLFMHRNAEFGGADDQAEEAIAEIAPEYHPWFKNIWEPPSEEVESLLFALQAALGAGLIGYYIGFTRGRQKGA
ncbi:energy-coupling factor ABC transporter substrate-binding protein [Desulfovirgula thermocuniculi]|uniref:energy-coupling factor ABC transporter substrate-binding protein n=1 Tax=Desulfovirgula thermocuniculi TaxID=348842 RepID=UPI00042461E7|nr:energy-coupling factor ABC transporter substrate-binding protein [Desulfovirgula thermocuniculi]